MHAYDKKEKRYSIEDLIEIMAKLRSENGCPWDRKQDLATLKQYLVEECYEVIDAIEANDSCRHKEELGDLLLQIIFQTHIQNERGNFNFSDVVDNVCKKLIRRHPHIFGNLTANIPEEVLKNWETIKANEKQAIKKNKVEAEISSSILDGIPKHLPALHKAHHIQQRAARVGFDWMKVRDVIEKIEEELKEVKEAIACAKNDRVRSEIGDLLFTVVNLVRFQEMNAEEVMNEAVNKFGRRFRALELKVNAAGKRLQNCSLEELDSFWEAVKSEENDAS
jgi:tetrapyrrole methylase family protein/MazG family protein